MNRIKLFLLFFLIIIILASIGFFAVKYLKEKQVSTQVEEYIPQEEISDQQLRRTMVNLYFYNNDTGNLEKELRFVDAKNLLDNPYVQLTQMLIDGPKSNKLKSLIPEGTIVYNAEIKGSCVTVDMSIDFLNHTEDKDLKNKMINSIVNTLTELTEVDSVKFLINGKSNDEFDEEYIRV